MQSERQYVAWSEAQQRPILYDPVTGRYEGDAQPALFGAVEVETPGGMVLCRPVFDLLAEHCAAISAGAGAGDLRDRAGSWSGGRRR